MGLRFCWFGEDKQTLSKFKKIFEEGGSTYLGSIRNGVNILRVVRKLTPDLLVVEVSNRFGELKPILEVINEETLTACVLIIDSRHKQLMDFLQGSKVVSFVTKPVLEHTLPEVIDLSIFNYNRVLRYEKEIKRLREALEGRKAVEKAKRILMGQDGLTEFEAYETIRKKSRDNRLPMSKTAKAIILCKG